MNLHSTCFNFQKKNLTWPILNFIILIIYYPIEIIVFAFLFGKIFSKIGDIEKHFKSIMLLFLIIIIAYIIVESLTAIKERLDSYYYPKMEHSIRIQLVDIIFNKMQINYESINSGEFIGRLLKIPTFVSFFYERFNRWALPFLITIVGVIIFFLVMNFRMGLISLITFSIYLLVFYFVCKSDINYSIKRENKENRMLEDIDDALNNSFSIITSGKINDEKMRLHKIHNSFDDSLYNQMKNGTTIRWTISILNIISFAVLTGTTLYLYKNNKIKNSTTITFIVILVFLVKQLRVFAPRVSEIFTYYGTLVDNDKFVKELIKETIIDGYIDNINLNGNIEFKNVSFKYPGSTQLALKNVSFKIKDKEKVAIIGKSASGKTSIIKLLLGFYKINEGKILISNNNVESLSRTFLRNNISIVHQNVKLFNRNVIDNIAYGTKYSKEEIKIKLENLNVMSVFNKLPNGLDTYVGKYGDKLSGGQKQIIYMLRCYFRENPIIILDEPTSAIDQYHKKYVFQMIEELSKKGTIIIVSHDPEIFNNKLFNRKFYIDTGVLKELK